VYLCHKQLSETCYDIYEVRQTGLTVHNIRSLLSDLTCIVQIFCKSDNQAFTKMRHVSTTVITIHQYNVTMATSRYIDCTMMSYKLNAELLSKGQFMLIPELMVCD
jgi:hypothetical protein